MNYKRQPFEAGFTIGFIGGGQLARMSALQAFRFGMNIAVYATSSSTEPVEQMTPHVVRGGLDDEIKLIEFARMCDVITLENEFVDGNLLTRVREASGTPIYPLPSSFVQIGDKLTEKDTFKNAGIPVTPYAHINGTSDLERFGDQYGWPYVLKSAKGGYDGYGNATVKDVNEAIVAFDKLGGNRAQVIIAEAFVPYTMELAVMVARNATGYAVYPCVESIQQNHICKEVIAPARIAPELQVQAQQLAIAAVEAIDGIGIFGFEFFLTPDNQILLNESAPRPHNSGHYTIEGCVTSQFENHIRAVSGLPLGSTQMVAPAAVMINLLGAYNEGAHVRNPESVLSDMQSHLHIYGKSHSKIGRKMGHLTCLGHDIEETLSRARHLSKLVSI